MTQLISFQYRDPEDTELLDRCWEGIIEPGVKQGFEVTLGTDPPQTTITIRPGVLVTNDYCRVEEKEALIDVCEIPPSPSADPRWDLVVCEHRYLRSNPPPVAEYYIIQGTPDANPTLPDVPENCIPLAYCYIPAGATQYSEIVNFITHMKYNCYWDDADGSWHIRFGAKMALLVSITPNSSSAMGVNQGMRIFIHPGGVADGDPISWTRVMELTPDGFTELLELAQEVIEARGSCASLDNRLDKSLNEDGTYIRVGILDQVMDEVEQARGSMASLDTRLDVSLNNDRSYRRVGLLDDVMDEVEDARGSKPTLDDRLDISLNNDGTIKPSALQDKIAHADLTDMPDSAGANTDHDGRYRTIDYIADSQRIFTIKNTKYLSAAIDTSTQPWVKHFWLNGGEEPQDNFEHGGDVFLWIPESDRDVYLAVGFGVRLRHHSRDAAWDLVADPITIRHRIALYFGMSYTVGGVSPIDEWADFGVGPPNAFRAETETTTSLKQWNPGPSDIVITHWPTLRIDAEQTGRFALVRLGVQIDVPTPTSGSGEFKYGWGAPITRGDLTSGDSSWKDQSPFGAGHDAGDFWYTNIASQEFPVVLWGR